MPVLMVAVVIAAVLVPAHPFLGIDGWSSNAAVGAAQPPGTPGVAASVCPAPPRPFAEIAALAEAPDGQLRMFQLGTPGAEIATPVPPTGGAPAAPEVTEAVTAAVHELYACMNSGDMLHATALWTDDFLRRGLGGLDVEILAGLATPVTMPGADQATIIAVDDVRLLADGRVSAFITFDDRQAVHIFVLENGRYLLDGGYDVSVNGTPVP